MGRGQRYFRRLLTERRDRKRRGIVPGTERNLGPRGGDGKRTAVYGLKGHGGVFSAQHLVLFTGIRRAQRSFQQHIIKYNVKILGY